MFMVLHKGITITEIVFFAVHLQFSESMNLRHRIWLSSTKLKQMNIIQDSLYL